MLSVCFIAGCHSETLSGDFTLHPFGNKNTIAGWNYRVECKMLVLPINMLQTKQMSRIEVNVN